MGEAGGLRVSWRNRLDFVEIGRRLILLIVTISGIRKKSTRNMSCKIYGAVRAFLFRIWRAQVTPPNRSASMCFPLGHGRDCGHHGAVHRRCRLRFGYALSHQFLLAADRPSSAHTLTFAFFHLKAVSLSTSHNPCLRVRHLFLIPCPNRFCGGRSGERIQVYWRMADIYCGGDI